MSDHPGVLRDNFGLIADWVEETRQRSGWPVRAILNGLDVAPSSFYRLRSQQLPRADASTPKRSVRHNVYELLPEERMLVLDYALANPDPRHRALAWEMADAGIVCASPASIYRVLKEKGLVPGWRLSWSGKTDASVRRRAQVPDERWLLDWTYIGVNRHWRYLLYAIDEYSRYVVHWEFSWRMDDDAASAAVERALSAPGRQREPEIKTDNGPAFISHEFKRYLVQRGIEHHRIHPHCPQENGIVERGIRTLKELAGDEFDDDAAAWAETGRAVEYYNHERRHSALYYLRPIDYYRGDPKALLTERTQRMAAAREHRRQVNLGLNSTSHDGLAAATKQAKDSTNPTPVLSHLA